ncbi:MAG TPA: bifunctional (p)ppGpp synthetase/guanosine-3',5'-bis(diphosphate) 3'-pyrophosphohydrolase [Burkholderiales bacterium]|nr:bifunctional (p)ppGpp synthetase/guanosine-3',5'-bis(diphosphate) 3'-pyrophosphohydrolase [Burkholderiales bacterium]
MVTVVRPAAADEAQALASGLAPEEREPLERALAFARETYGDAVLGTGEPALAHALGLAANVAALRLDAEARIAGLMFAAPNYVEDSDEKIKRLFGARVASLVAGITRLNELRVVVRSAGTQTRDARAQAETLRKMLLAMVQDIRVVLLRLASRAQTLRFLAQAPAGERREIARETLDIYAPLANRLGVWQLKWELEDLSFRYLEPELYKKIAGLLEERRTEREAFIAAARERLARALASAGIAAEVVGRPKHIYSIWTKMRAKGLDFSQLHDVRALRVLVDEVKDCYAALGVVHDLWTPIPQQFDDYISRPKENAYRSLHTAVMAEDGRALEVQIRTHEMHREAELGVAAHWRYKEGARRPARGADALDERIAWLRQMLAWRDEIVDASGGPDLQALDDTVYALTPQGRVIDLPKGSTPIDFAYALHTDVGHRCRGAKVNGAMVPLDTPLANGDRVEIVTAKQGGPSRDWLNPDLGYLASSRARNKVRQWFNREAMEETVAAGRAAVERELQREGRKDASLEDLAARLGYERAEDLFAAAGREEVGARQIQAALRGEDASAPPRQPAVRPSRAPAGASGILVVGVDRLLTQLARCCKPVPPDPIAGFVTKGRGVSIHRRDCASLARLVARAPERHIAAGWGEQGARRFAADLALQATDRQGLLRDVTEVLSRERINVTALSTQTRHSIASMQFTVEVDDGAHLQRALALLREVRGVMTAARR